MSERNVLEESPKPVDVQILIRREFDKEILGNGKLNAIQKIPLKFKVSGELELLNVNNGTVVQQGDIIAKLNSFEFQQNYNKAEIALGNSELEMKDMLLLYQGSNDDGILEQAKQSIALRSNYLLALNELKSQSYYLQNTIIKSPINGKIVDVKSVKHQFINQSETVCTVIDDSELQAEFMILESELFDVKIGDQVTMTLLFGANKYNGIISEINPSIDQNGMTLVKARVKNPGKLVDGSNVKITIKKRILNQMVVPKSAVLKRQNQDVIFKYEHGRAYWIYVKLIMENSDYYNLTADVEKGSVLNFGDTIIFGGNLSLAHDNLVQIKSSK